MAIAGDTLQIKNMELYINGVKQPFPAHHEFKYLVTTTAPLDADELIKQAKEIIMQTSTYQNLTGNTRTPTSGGP